MRKLILFFTVIAFGLTMTSCLKTGDNSYGGEKQLFYISQLEGMQVAHNGSFMMTSPEIKAARPGAWYRISWSWTTENGMAATNVHNAITTQIEKVATGLLLPEEAPQQISAPVLAVDMGQVQPSSVLPLTATFGDYLLFRYKWNKKEGETVEAILYSDAAELDASGTVTLDFRLRKIDTSTATSGTDETGLVAIRMGLLRTLINNFEGQDYKDIQLKFNYYKTETEKVTTVPYQVRVYKN